MILSEMVYQETLDYFKNQGYETILFKKQNKPYEAVCHHPDMFMFYDDELFLENSIELEGIHGEAIGIEYPETIKYNVAKVAGYVICHKEHVAECLKAHFTKKNYEWIHVNQGYAKCSTAVIGDGIITSDKGIYNACAGKVDRLLIRSGHIQLPGMSTGFIGGTCVCMNGRVFFNGDITEHPDYDSIRLFIESKGYEIDCIKRPLMDVGSFIVIERSE